jgi:hypothetical protein
MNKDNVVSREYKCKSQFDLSKSMRHAQSLILSGPKQVLGAAGNYKLTGTAARASILQVLSITSSDKTASISSIKIAGQSLNVTDQDASVFAFDADVTALGAKQRYIGIAVKSQQASTIAIDGALTAAGTIGFGVSTQPLEDFQVPTIESQAEFYNYFGGLGEAVIAAGGTGKLSCRTTRSCKIGQLLLNNITAGVGNEDLSITSVEVNGLEYLSGNDDGETPLEQFGAKVGDVLGNLVHATVEANAEISITLKNVNAAPATVQGVFFCM